MPWPESIFHIVVENVDPPEQHPWLKLIALIAPPFSLIASIASVSLAVVVYRYTRKKNDNDVKIKWFQELVYSPSKDAIAGYFASMHAIGSEFIEKEFTSEDRIAIMSTIKLQRQQLLLAFVDMIKPISEEVHKSVLANVDALTDTLTHIFDDDDLVIKDQQSFSTLISSPVTQAKRNIVEALFKYTGN